MASPLRISEVVYHGDNAVVTEDSDVTVFVGPNGSGKSRTLLEIVAMVVNGRQNNEFFALQGIKMRKMMDDAALSEWLRTYRFVHETQPGQHTVSTPHQNSVQLERILSQWRSGHGHLEQLGNMLVKTLMPRERLSLIQDGQRLNFDGPPSSITDVIIRDAEKLQMYREALKRAFGFNLIVDGWGDQIRFKVSREVTQDDLKLETDTGLISREMSKRLNELQLLNTESDGVLSFAGMLLWLLSEANPIVLIDEPEAFLHPPQARQIGAALASLRAETQVFVATHSLDVLLGALSVPSVRLSVVRLIREGGRTTPHLLSSDKVRNLWSDPLLRTSRAFDGLFHDGVIVCEGDADSQFYSAVLADLDGSHGTWAESSAPQLLDLMFVYSGGKQRMGMIADALRAVGVPVRMIADFDVLNDIGTLKRLVQSLDAEFTDEMVKAWRIVDAALRGNDAPRKAGPALAAISAALGDDRDRVLTAADRNAIRVAVAPARGWDLAKQHGKTQVTGVARQSLDELMNKLKDSGLFIVPSGAVESFVPQVGGHGPSWVMSVIEQGRIRDARESKDFVAEVLASFGQYL